MSHSIIITKIFTIKLILYKLCYVQTILYHILYDKSCVLHTLVTSSRHYLDSQDSQNICVHEFIVGFLSCIKKIKNKKKKKKKKVDVVSFCYYTLK